MADPIDTGKKTVTGRTIWRDSKTGEDYSERSTTFEIDGIYYTMPTVAEDGSQYTDDQIRDYVKKYGPSDYLTGEELPKFKSQEDAIEYAISRSDTRKKKEEPMLEKQMEMFNEGGLKDEGGSVDPVSGNDVPIGSTKEEVRDDIPAMVSEGEFVFPADVVRYIGLNNLMNMRQEAKMGLKKMEAMGQMGNGDEATLPDDMPFGMADIVIVEGSDEPKEMAQGGVIQAQTGKFITPMFNPSDQDNREYKNAQGESLFIPFLNGEPVYPIPAGYFPVGQAPTETEAETPAPAEDDGGGGGDRGPRKNAFTEAGSWAGSPLDMYIKEAEKVSAYGNMAAGATAALNPVVGMFVFGALKNEKRKLNNTIDARIKEAEKAGLTDSVAALKAVKKRMSPEGQSVLEQAQSTVVDAFKSLLGIEKGTKEATKVDNAIVNAGKVNVDTSDADVEKLAKVSVEDTFAEDMLSAKAETDEGTRFAYPDEENFESTAEQMQRAEFMGEFTKPENITSSAEQMQRAEMMGEFTQPENITSSAEQMQRAEFQMADEDIRAYIESIKDPKTAADAFNNVTNVIDQTQTSTLRGRNKGRTNIRSTEDQTNEVLESGPVIKDTTSAGVIADKPDLDAAQKTKNKKRRKKHQAAIDKLQKGRTTADERKKIVKKATGVETSGQQETAGLDVGSGAGGKDYVGPMRKGGLASRKK